MTQQQQDPQQSNYGQPYQNNNYGGQPSYQDNGYGQSQNGYGQPPNSYGQTQNGYGQAQNNGPQYQQPGQSYPQPQNYPPQGYPQQPGYYPPAQPAKKGGFPVWAIFLLAIPIVVVAGCLIISLIVSSLASHAIDSAATAVSDGSGTIGAISGQNGTVGTSEQVKPIQVDLATTPVRSFNYAGLKITVKKGQISNQILSNPPRYRANAAHLDLTLTFTNPSSRDIQISSALLQITLADGSVYKNPFDFGVRQQDTQDQTYTFNNIPATATWSKAQLTLSQVGKEPVTLPLDGAVPAAAYPKSLSATGALNLKNPDVDYTLKDARLDLDAHGNRAPTGQRYLILTITITSHAPNGAYIGEGNFRLIIDGTPQAPDSSDIPIPTGNLDKTTDSTIIFLIPDSAQAATLQLGEQSQLATIPVSLTATK
jgi:hypothetical protein